jgi:hypothetical protein
MSDCKCDLCGHEMVIGEHPFCPHESVLRSHPFKEYDVDIDGKMIHISGIHDALRYEKEADRRFRNGEGAPIAFRAFHQDSSNLDANVFGETPQIKPSGRGAVRGRDSTGTEVMGSFRDFIKGRR